MGVFAPNLGVTTKLTGSEGSAIASGRWRGGGQDTNTAAIHAAKQVTSRADSKPAAKWSSVGSGSVGLVDCNATATVPPVNVGRMTSSVPDEAQHYFVSFGWWEPRLKRPNFRAGRPLQGNPTVTTIQTLLRDTADGAALVDVGANVGFMAMFGASLRRPVFAIDPISYDIAKLCEGYKANLDGRVAAPGIPFRLFHAAAGPEYAPNITVLRNADEVGYFDQSSVSAEVFGNRAGMVEERIPMITVDSIVPEDVPVGVVKIDVQGVEHGVLLGMDRLLSRETDTGGPPKYVFFEDDDTAVRQAGYRPGESREFLQEHGYRCDRMGHDTLCTKDQ
eukprot:CAMPEP_0181059376 /NCGR_PEP_ID=MMETSP1070-20121207/21351_1 /TAXON_ID=265543 /ORGANISM="Minutocellus polymorphus, Strain NH13" /LENGTH=333 /DNA_ID=CAMNT_0023139053 /DNA_START=382 /DNA_END=1384 /DNA_ORIENTATION=+